MGTEQNITKAWRSLYREGVSSPGGSEGSLELTIVVPTFNEYANVTSLVNALETVLCGVQWEVLFVDDHSPDGTAEQIRSASVANPRVRLLERIGRRGLSSACIEGMCTTIAPFIAVMDADLQHDEGVLPEMLHRLKTESLDLVVGSRAVPGGGMGEISAGRVMLSHLGSKAAHLFCNSELSDAMSGFFMLRRSFFEKCVARMEGIGFKVLLELLAASEMPPRIAEVPYTFRPRGRGSSKFGVCASLAYLRFLGRRFSRSFGATVRRVGEPALGGLLHRR